MYHFQYVTEKELSSQKKNLIKIIQAVQHEVRKDFTFQFKFVGSVKRNMVTWDVGTNVGFDFDVDLVINEGGEISPKEMKTKIRLALNRVAPRYGYDNAEDSTRVLTINVKDKKNSKILHSCDIAIVNNYVDNDGSLKQKYIRFEKGHNSYVWQEQPKGYYSLTKKEQWVKSNGFWDEMRKLYLHKKNNNSICTKHSRSIYAETIHQICQKYGYYKS